MPAEHDEGEAGRYKGIDYPMESMGFSVLICVQKAQNRGEDLPEEHPLDQERERNWNSGARFSCWK